jgi:alanine racemase
MRPLVAEIRVQSLRQNYRLLRQNMRRLAGPDADALAVIKANAYGHGLALCGRALAEEGAAWLGVTCVDEAVALLAALRGAASPRVPAPRILVMSGFFPGEEGLLLRHGLTGQVWEPWHLGLLDAAARRAGMAPGTVPVHLEIDTGMSRQGVAPGEALALLLRSAGAGSAPSDTDSPVRIDGVMTHFSSPGQPENGVMQAQMRAFAAALDQLRERGIRPSWVHAGNSVNAGLGLEMPALAQLARDMGASPLVRPGIALYGCGLADSATAAVAEEAAVRLEPLALEPVLSWKTRIVALRDLAPGAAVGYDETFRAERPMRVALLPAGYADGYDRAYSNRGAVLVRGQRAPVVGRVSMDQTIVDVTDIPDAARGDEVVLLGAQGAGRISTDELARLLGTIPWEVLCRIAERVPRVAV